jgi:hypothetical protein
MVDGRSTQIPGSKTAGQFISFATRADEIGDAQP